MDNFYTDLRNWYILDNEFRSLSLQINEVKNEKNHLKNKITNFVLSNKLEKKSIKIDDNEFKFVNLKHSQPLTYKFLKDCLDECIANPEQVNQLIEFIKSKRDIKEYIDLKKSI